MRKFLAILAGKGGRLVGKLLGRGSSLPGKLALKICPDILRRLKLPKYVVAVTGSNGKTSTVELIAHVLRQAGLSVAYNKEGSNQIEGVTTFLLWDCTLSGKIKSDVVLLETDERFARHTFQHFVPTHYLFTNLYRDQMTRNGHPQWMYRILEESVHPESRLILNADDPMVARFGIGRDNVAWFGVARQETDQEEAGGAYDDGAYCPNCMAPMEYDFRHFNHVGGYRCAGCGHHRPQPDYEVSKLDLEGGTVVLDGHTISLSLPNYYHCYNTLAAFALCRELGLPGEQIAAILDGYHMTSGRVVTFKIGEAHGTLLASKHENSISYDQSIRYAVQSGKDCTVVVIVDAISRKYFTSETSWLWDVDFELLAAEQVKKVVLAGRYCHDLAVRFSCAGVPETRIDLTEDIGEAVELLKNEAVGDIFVITCFSDKDKLLEKVEVEK